MRRFFMPIIMKFRYLLITLVTAVSLVILGSQFNWKDLADATRQMNPWYLLPGIFIYLSSIAARSLRWGIMTHTIKPMRFFSLFQYVTLGFMTNNLLPARLGEVVRAYVTGKRENTSRSAMFASIVLERIFDGMVIVLLFVVTMFITGLRNPLLFNVAWMSTAVFALGFGFLLLLTYRRTMALAIADKVLMVFPDALRQKALGILHKFVRGLVLLHHPRDFAKVFALSFVVWGAELLVYLVFFEAFAMEVPLKVAIIALVFVNLSSMLPALPANALVFQVACSEALIRFGGISQGTALAYSVVLHATQILPVILLGYIFMSFLGLTWNELRHVDLSEDENGETPAEASE